MLTATNLCERAIVICAVFLDGLLEAVNHTTGIIAKLATTNGWKCNGRCTLL